MAKFDKNQVVTILQLEDAEIEKKYWFSDDLLLLKHCVENGDNDGRVGVLYRIEADEEFAAFPFRIKDNGTWKFLYPYEEEPKKRMTNLQLAEWCAKGNGQFSYGGEWDIKYTNYAYNAEDDKEVAESTFIRPFGQIEWVEPTVDIYERDCCSVNFVEK